MNRTSPSTCATSPVGLGRGIAGFSLTPARRPPARRPERRVRPRAPLRGPPSFSPASSSTGALPFGPGRRRLLVEVRANLIRASSASSSDVQDEREPAHRGRRPGRAGSSRVKRDFVQRRSLQERRARTPSRTLPGVDDQGPPVALSRRRAADARVSLAPGDPELALALVNRDAARCSRGRPACFPRARPGRWRAGSRTAASCPSGPGAARRATGAGRVDSSTVCDRPAPGASPPVPDRRAGTDARRSCL